jgi:signal transduction histidine kinase
MDARAELRYRNETLQLVRRRGPVAVSVFALGLALADTLEWYYSPARLHALLIGSAVEVAICLGAWRLYATPRFRRYAIRITQATGGLLLLCVTLYFHATAGNGTALALVVMSVQLVTALMFPWGFRGQFVVALVSIALYGAYIATAPASTASGLPFSYGLLAVTFGAAFASTGATLLDRQRRAVFEQRDRLDQHISTFQNLTQTFHGFDPQRVLLVACFSMLQDFRMRRLWAVWQATDDGALQAYAARRDGDGVTMEVVPDAARLWSVLGSWGAAAEPFVAGPSDPRVPRRLGTEAAGSTLCVPLRFGNETLGGILCDRGDEPGALPPDTLVVASVLASGVAIAMANARLYLRATRASEEKSTFLARIAHELRNPLHTMLWDVDTLAAEGGGPAVVERLRQNALMTLNAAEELQEFSEVETRQVAICPEPVDLRQVFGELQATAVALLADRPVAVVSQIGRGAETWVTDPYRLRQILGNLLSNATKFTTKGTIHLGAERRGNEITLSVRDTGAGIDQTELESIFTPFYRGSAPVAAPRRGMGLGLAIAQEIAALLGGRIEVESAVGVGSTFRLVLPLTASAIAREARAGDVPQLGRTATAA